MKQKTLSDVLETERLLVEQAPVRWGSWFVVAAELSNLLRLCVSSINGEHFIAAMFLSQVKKHHLLSLISVVRLHRVQAMMNLRQVLEAGACAAFAIAHPGVEGFADATAEGMLKVSQGLSKKRYVWLDKNFGQQSKLVKDLKGTTIQHASHSNILHAHDNFTIEEEAQKFSTPFFDKEDDYRIKTDLYIVGNVAFCVMDLLLAVNEAHGRPLQFMEEFAQRRELLGIRMDGLRREAMETDRFKAVEARGL